MTLNNNKPQLLWSTLLHIWIIVSRQRYCNRALATQCYVTIMHCFFKSHDNNTQKWILKIKDSSFPNIAYCTFLQGSTANEQPLRELTGNVFSSALWLSQRIGHRSYVLSLFWRNFAMVSYETLCIVIVYAPGYCILQNQRFYCCWDV